MINKGSIRITAFEQNISIFWLLNPDNSFEGLGSVEASNINGIWWINRALVKPPTLRNNGIGTHLLKLLINEIKKLHGKLIMVTPGGYEQLEKKQFNFYRKNGFVNVTTEMEMTPKERKYTLVYSK